MKARLVRPATLAGVFFACLAVHTTFLGVAPPELLNETPTDYEWKYRRVAYSLLAGHGHVWRVGRSLYTAVPPGYPLWVAGTYAISNSNVIRDRAPIQVSNVLALALSSVFVFLISEQMLGSRARAGWASLLWITYPLLVWMVPLPLSEVPFILFLYIGVWAALKAAPGGGLGWSFGAGVSFGVTALIRPIGIAIPPVAFAAMALTPGKDRRARLISAALVVFGFVAAVLPWETYVYRETGQIIPLSSGGGSALMGGLVWITRPEAQAAGLDLPADVVSLVEQAERIWQESARDKGAVVSFLATQLLENPIAMAKLAAMKATRPWYGTYSMQHDGAVLAMQILYFLLAVPGMVLLIKARTLPVGPHILPAALMFAFYGMAIIFPPNVRFLVPTLGLMLAYPAAALDYVATRAARRVRAQRSGQAPEGGGTREPNDDSRETST